ncbi:MAG: oxidative damage protection protein [Gemmatimonadales bacterium]
MPTITCARCGLLRDQQPFPLFQNELGRRAFETICADCWGEWLKHQQALINHYALNLRDPKAKEFLFQQMEQFLFTSATQS